MTLEEWREIRTLLAFMDQPRGDCEPVNHLLDEHIVHVDVRLQELQRLKEQLTALRQLCATAQSIGQCGIIHGLAAMETEEKGRSVGDFLSWDWRRDGRGIMLKV